MTEAQDEEMMCVSRKNGWTGRVSADGRPAIVVVSLTEILLFQTLQMARGGPRGESTSRVEGVIETGEYEMSGLDTCPGRRKRSSTL